MRACILKISFLLGLLMIMSTWAADERGTKEEAMAMVKAGIEHVKAVGVEKATKDFMSGDPKWKNKDLYVSFYSLENDKVVIVAHGVNEKLVGKDLTDIKDANDKQFLKEALQLAKKDGGWVEYAWPDPVTKKVSPKVSYIQATPDKKYAVLVGVYK